MTNSFDVKTYVCKIKGDYVIRVVGVEAKYML